MARWWGLSTPAAKKKFVTLLFGFILVVSLLVLVVVLALKGLARSDFFQISSFEISGNHRITKSEIITLSGLDIYSNLLSVDVEVVGQRIEAHEWIDRVVLKKKWPNLLKINIRERKPLAIINTRKGLYYVDENADVFSRIGLGSDLDYPVLSGMEAMVSVDDEGVAAVGDSYKIKEVLSLIHRASNGGSSFPRQNISQISLDKEGMLVLYLTDRPFPIYLGEDITVQKFKRLKKVLYWLYKKRDIATVDYIRLDYTENKVLVSKKIVNNLSVLVN